MSIDKSSLWQAGRGDLAKLVLTTKEGARAEVYRHGAHLTSWRTAKGKEWIFTSEQAQFAPGQAIRGGVPVIFPQFNAFGSGPRHGFARNLPWQSIDAPTASLPDTCTLTLESSDHTKAAWDYRFAATYMCEISDNQLRMTLQITNTDSKAFQFTAALHTYFAIAALKATRLEGLQGLSYWDNDGSDFKQRAIQQDDELSFNDAIDRVYFNCNTPLILHDGEQRLRIASEGFTDVVVWNPGREAASMMADMAADEYQKMLCIEAAAIDQPLVLEPGEVWRGSQILTA